MKSKNYLKTIILSFLAFLFIINSIFYGPKINWKKIFDLNNFAAVFQTSTPGYWNITETWGSPSLIQFNNPQNLAISQTGEIYVADTDIHRIDVMNSDGTASTSYNVSNNPFGIAIDSDGKIYLATAHIGVVVLNADGTYLTTYSYPSTDYQSIVIASDKLYLADSDNDKIDILNMDGSIYASYSSTTVTLAYPRGLAVSSTTGEIYVANQDSALIVVINPDGTASTTYNVGASNNFDVDLPGDGRIYVTNRGGSIFVLDSNGSIIDTYSSGLGLSAPHSIFIATSGKMYITNIGGGNIQEGHITVLNTDGTLYANYNSPSYVPGYVSTEGIDFPGMSDDVTISTGVVTLNQTQNVHNVTLASGGTLNLDDFVLNVYGHWWNFINTGGTLQNDLGFINFPSTSTDIENDATINSGTITLTQDQYVNNINFTGGTLNLAGRTLNVNGNLVRTSGVLTSNSGTINLIGTSTQSISGENTFGNLTKASTASSSLFFTTTATTTVTGNISLNGSPNNLLSISPLVAVSNYDFSGKVTTMLGGGFWGLTGITLDSSNNIYTVEQGGRVGKFDSSLNYISSFTYGAAGPYNIARDSLGNIYVSEQNHSIKKFNSSGSLLLTIGAVGSGDGQFSNPLGMTFDSSGNLFVVDEGNNRVQKFNSVSGAYISQFGTAGSGYGQFSGLIGIDVDSSDNIYTTETGNNRVQKFDSSGVYVSQFGTVGSGDGEFNTPKGIAIDSSNNIYVADQANNRVQKFDSSGNYILQFGTAGSGDGQFSGLLGIAVDSLNNVYTSEQGNSRIQKFNAPISVSDFKILKTGSGSASFSYLNVVNSNNVSSEVFYCRTGCVDGGGNTNWVFTPGSTFSSRLSSINILPLNQTIFVGSTTQFIATTLNQRGNIFQTSVDWSSSNTYVGTINTNGLFTSISPGTTTITASAEGITNSTDIFVVSTPILSTIISASSTNDTVIIVDKEDNKIDTNILESRLEESFCFTKNLSYGETDNDVKNLQTFLNDNNYNLSTWGPGSYEEETKYFGWLTRNAVVKLQETNFDKILAPVGLTTGTGNFGNLTRKFVNDSFGTNCITIPEAKATTTEKVATTTEEISTTTDEEIIPEIITPDINTTIPEVTQTKPNTKPEVTKPTAEKPTFDINNIFDQQFVLGVMDIMKESYDQVSFLILENLEKIKNILKDSTISITTKVITTTALVFGVAASISTVAFATPVSFTEIWMIPARVWGLLLGALGIRRKQRQWGTVYDSVTKRPLDPVYVSLINTETNKEVVGAITDIDGRYGFLVLPGKYKIVATKTNYIQPSKKMAGKSFDEVYNDLYFGEELVITDGEMITKNIPMDSQSFDWNEFAKTKMNVNKFTRQKDITWAKISKFVFVIGALVSIVAVVAAPQPYNYVIAGFYVLAYILNFIVFKTKKSGTLIEKNTKIPLSFAIIKIFREGEENPLTKKIADKFGGYYALVPNGKYFIKIEKKNDDGTYTEVFQSSILEITKGVINFNLNL